MRAKRRGLLVLILISAIAAMAGASEAYMRGGGWWGVGSKYGKMYDPKTVETVKGTVESIGKFTPVKGMSQGVHMTIKTDTETIDVHLGPSWFIDKQKMKLEANDSVEVKGSRVTFDGKPAIIAAEVRKEGEEALKLRDDNGIPVWGRKGKPGTRRYSP